MKKWNVNTASIVGRDHELSKKNRQDFLTFSTSDNLIVGVVCDGCGESQYSEVGAALIGTFIKNYFQLFKHHQSSEEIKLNLEVAFQSFISALQSSLLFFSSQKDRISFIKEFLLSTCLFCVILDDRVIIGHCGDGLIIKDRDIRILDQAGSPHYIAYQSIPKEVLESDPSKLSFFEIEIINPNDITNIIIGTDGIQPIIDKNLLEEIYGTQKRQLQRKFNLWQQQKIFCDDASCIVFEKQNENSNLQTTTNPT